MVGRFYYKTIAGNSFYQTCARLWVYLFGTLDFHSHIRYLNIKRYFRKTERNIEIGAGDGLMSGEFFLKTHKPILAVSYLREEVIRGKKLMRQTGMKAVDFVQGDALKLTNIRKNYYDQCLLIDVLEHVGDDKLVLRNINKILKAGGYLVLSVPTPNYPKKISREYAKTVGHVRDGYFPEDIERLLKINGFRVVKWHYYSNRLTSWICNIIYGKPEEQKYFFSKLFSCLQSSGSNSLPQRAARVLKRASIPIFYLISFFDQYYSTDYAGSLAVSAQKIKDV